MSAYDDLLEERYGRASHAWWETPAKTVSEDPTMCVPLLRLLETALADSELRDEGRAA